MEELLEKIHSLEDTITTITDKQAILERKLDKAYNILREIDLVTLERKNK